MMVTHFALLVTARAKLGIHYAAGTCPKLLLLLLLSTTTTTRGHLSVCQLLNTL